MTSAECHLTQEEVDEVLMGVSHPQLEAHCAACRPCRDCIATLSESLECYNHASLAWAEARSNTFTRDLSGHKPAWRLTAAAARSVAATLVFGLIAGVTAGTRLRPVQSAGESLEATAPVTRAVTADARGQQIARDNAMLEAIDAELTEPDSAPPALFHATEGTAAQPSSVQDRD